MKPLDTRLAPYAVFFPLAAVGTVVAIVLTLLALDGRWTPPGGLSPIDWHAHEMLFGHFPAAFAGVMLTALPRWTKGAGVPPGVTLTLASLWLAARFAFIAPTAGLEQFQSVVYEVALAAYAGWRVVRAGDRRDLGLVALLILFAIADAVFLVGARTGDAALGLRLGLSATALAAMVMGGRIAPALTRHLAEKRGHPQAPPTPWPFEVAVLGLAVVALAAWVIAPQAAATAVFLAVAALAHAARLATWRGWSTLDRPPFLALHLGYAFLPLGLALHAAGIATADLRLADLGVHAWGAGTLGLMCAAVMTSVVRRYAGLGLAVSRTADLLCAALLVAATARLAAGLFDLARPLLYLSATAWVIGYGALLVLVARDRRLPAPPAEDDAA